MLEAAMLGIPYEGRMPAMNEPWQPAAPPAPEVVAQRQLREEQDAAYQASLLVSMFFCFSFVQEQQYCSCACQSTWSGDILHASAPVFGAASEVWAR